MNLEQRYQTMLNTLNSQTLFSYTEQQIYSLVDLTCLNEQATATDLQQLAQRAQQFNVAAICVYPQHLAAFNHMGMIKRATVVNFPTGQQPIAQVLQQIEHALYQQVDEIDYVFPYQLYLSGQQEAALGHVQTAYQRCKQQACTFKIILETGAWPSMASIYQLSTELLQLGCDFLKTSTGKIAVGATESATFAMLAAIKDSQFACGIKLSGGIRTIAQASRLMHVVEYLAKEPLSPTWFRLGTSGLQNQS